MKVLRFIFDWLFRITVVYAMGLVIGMVVINATNVFCRYLLNFSLSWNEEISLIMFVHFSFIALAIAVYLNTHMSIELFTMKLPKKTQLFLQKFSDVVVMGLGALIMYGGIQKVRNVLNLQSIAPTLGSYPATGWPGWIDSIFIPISGILVMYGAFMNLFNVNKGHNPLETSFDMSEVSDV